MTATIPEDVVRLAKAQEANRLGPATEPEGPTWPKLDETALYGLAGDIVRTIEPQTEADPVAVLAQLLVAVGSMLNRNPHFCAEADRHYLNLFVALVGSTAKGRKGTSWGHVRRIVEEIDPEWAAGRVVSGLSSGEGLIWNVRDPIYGWKTQRAKKGTPPAEPERVMTDPGETDKRLLVHESELASCLKVMVREGNTLSPIIRLAWDSGSLHTLTKNSPAKATNAHISIIGHITQQELLRHLTATETANGFANRFLWLCVRRSKLLPEGGSLHRQDLSGLVRRLEAALSHGVRVSELHRDDAARNLWYDVYSRLSSGRPGLWGAVTARAEAQVMRLACLYAVLDQAREIRVEHLQAALALWRYAEESARYIFGEQLGDKVADHIIAELRMWPQGMALTQISDSLGRNRSAAEIKRALQLLEAVGLARRLIERAEGRGRPTTRWVAIASPYERNEEIRN